MPRILGLFPSSLLAAREGMSANAYYRNLRELGIAARRSEVLNLFKVSKSIIARNPEEPFRPLHEVPSGMELPQWPTRKGTGIAQTVTLVYRDRTTGKIQQTWWRTVTPEGITREEALATAIDAYSEHASRYGQDLIGAVHTSAYRLVPFGM